MTINRTTRYVYRAGHPMFELRDAAGHTFAMQSYCQEVDPALRAAQLPTLGSRLKLPAGWSYRTVTPAQDVNLDANGAATLVQDDLRNSYQKIESAPGFEVSIRFKTWCLSP
ncbi:MAG: hypothetical protein GIW95_07205 [Candidatus Eremiobacteraeota bacterium]|nr:hypothetical protein [Candidatus Eremiobacteraeota bacterium]